MSIDAPNHSRPAPFAVADLDYNLPPERIAQHPSPERDAARLLVLDRGTGQIHDRTIRDLPDLLRPGDLLVLNNTKVLPAKFLARRRTGGAVPGLFLSEESTGLWRVLLEGSKRLKIGEALDLEKDPPSSPLTKGGQRGVSEPSDDATSGHVQSSVALLLEHRLEAGEWLVRVSGRCADRLAAECSAAEILEAIGEPPLPPYIHRNASESSKDVEDVNRYQTVFAERSGAIAAPTAGLHFTEALLARLRARGIETAFVTLHVGIGTFKPIAVEDLSEHRMHAERYELPADAAAAITACRSRAGRVVAVGTTSVRVLESCADILDDPIKPGRSGETDIFIYPPHSFRATDAVLTNFHLPRSTLLALVMAFAGPERIRAAYTHAIEHSYRFYSYGDAMLIL